MKGLAKFLVETLLGEAAGMDKVVVVYSGRFQPFHKGHYATYDHLIKKFGKDNVYIGTSDVTDNKKSPFGFKEKKAIMMKMFGISSNKIVQIKNPYAPQEILNKFDSETTGFITVVGEKDSSRLSGKYFTPYKGKVQHGYLDKGYVYAAPAQPNAISGTDVRYWLSAGSEEERKKNFTKAYPKFDDQIFKIITLKLKKLKESINEEIKLNVNVGDTLLMGKFKNKKVVVKSIGKDEWGMPTINGKKAVTFRIPKKEELKEGSLGGYTADAGEPDTGYVPDGKPRILNTTKPEPWFNQGGYIQLHTPKADAMRGRGKSKDTETQFRKAYYKVKNITQSTLNPADDPHTVEDWQETEPNKVVDKPKRFWELPKNQKPQIISKEDIKEIVSDFDNLLDEMGLPGGAGVGLSLPGGYINGAPNPKDAKKLKSKLDGDGSEEYEPIEESSEKDLEKQLVVLYNKAFKMMPKSPAQMKVRAEIDKLKKQIDSLKKESLNEDVKWQEDTYKKCMLGKLPLSINIVQKLVEPIRTTSLHATDIDNLPKVAALQGTKKSISTFTQTSKYGKLVQGKGMHTKGGIMVALSGVVLAQSIMDLWTEPDKQGRRWVNPGTVISGLGREQDVVFNFAPELKPYKENWKKHSFDGTITNEEKAEFIKKYYDAAERYMLSKKKEFQDKYLNSNALYYDSDWNEVVLSQIKIESILVVPSLLKVKTQVGSWTFDREDKDETDKIIKQLKQKYKNVVVANNESDISNFIKKNGGYIKESVNEATASEVIKDLDKVRNDLIKKVDVLIAKKKKLYSNVDIESPMSADEKQLDKDIQSIFSQIQQLIQQKRKIKTESVNESLILEGGAYGHMNHPFDIEMNLTFGDLKNIVTKALNGDLELAREKTDGQALAVSWVNGRLVAARNKSHLKNKGEGAMTIGQVASKFAGRGGLTDAYNFAMQDLSKAIGSLSEPQRKKIFKDGACFMNLEVIYPTSVNVIPYNQPLLVFHGTFEYDIAGTIIGENQQAASILGGMIKQVNAHVQSKYTIQGPPMNKLPKSEHLSKLKGKYISMIGKLQSEFGLSDTDGVADYHQAWWTNFVEKGGKKLDAQEKIGLVKRWAFNDKSFRINTIQDVKLRAWAEQIDKQDQQKISKQNLMRFEEIFLGVGADVLSFMSSVLTANPESAKRQMVARLESTIQQVKASGDPKKIEKLKLELQRLNALGGFEKIVPNEGIVFVYGGNTYKLTGAFAPLNQILGIFFDS